MSQGELAVVGIAVVGWAWGLFAWWKYRREIVTLLRQILSELRRRK